MIYPTILCGGSGTRLWPLSRKSYPKQFAQLLGKETLFQASGRRLCGAEFSAPLIVTNSDFRFIASQQLAEIGISPSAVLIEPEGRNTAPAIAAAALVIAQKDPQGLLLIAPSDHAIPDDTAFRETVLRGAQTAQAGQIVTFGITPSRAETGYGYLELSTKPDGLGGAIPLTRFVEKPHQAAAEAMVHAGNYLWNAGIFLFRADVILQAFKDHAPAVLTAAQSAVAAAKSDLDFLRLDPDAWASAPSISIDYAVMERAHNLSVLPYVGAWSDLGGWDAVWASSDLDVNDVATSGGAKAIDCKNSLLRTEGEGVELVGIGLNNIIAVAMSDAVLVAEMSRAQDVKLAVETLRAKDARQAEAFPKDHRPWGWFESLAMGDRFQVKRIHVAPGAALSLQSHHHRAEHWIVVQGTAEVTIENELRLISENQSVYIPLGAKHRLRNPGKLPIILIEVQTGGYLGEDDIIRYEDVYARGQGAKG